MKDTGTSFWCNTSPCALPLLSEPEDDARLIEHLLPHCCIRARRAVVNQGKVWLEADRQRCSEMQASEASGNRSSSVWLLLPSNPGNSGLARVIGPDDPLLSTNGAFAWLSAMLAPEAGVARPLVFYCNAAPSVLPVYSEPSIDSKLLGNIAAFVTVGTDEHRLTGTGQVWARLSRTCSEQWYRGSEGWVCTTGSKGGSGLLEVEGWAQRSAHENSTVYAKNVFVRGPRALPLPLRAEPKLSAPVVEGAGLVPWTAREVRNAVLNEDGQVWLRIMVGGGEGQEQQEGLWVIRRSANEGQVVIQYCEGPSDSLQTAYVRNVFSKGALPLRTSPCLEAPAASRVPMGACLKAVTRVFNKQGHCWIGVLVGGEVLYAIAWHARDGSTILQEVQAPDSGGEVTQVYRVLQGGLRAVCTPGYQGAAGRGDGRELNAGECFRSSERRVNERQEMWIRVDAGSTTGEDLWVPESSGGVTNSVVALQVAVDQGPTIPPPTPLQPPPPRVFSPLPLVPVIGKNVVDAKDALLCQALQAPSSPKEEQGGEEEGERQGVAQGAVVETEEGMEDHLLHEVFGFDRPPRTASAHSAEKRGLLQDLDVFAEASRTELYYLQQQQQQQGRRTPTQPSMLDEQRGGGDHDDDEDGSDVESSTTQPLGCCGRIRAMLCPKGFIHKTAVAAATEEAHGLRPLRGQQTEGRPRPNKDREQGALEMRAVVPTRVGQGMGKALRGMMRQGTAPHYARVRVEEVEL